MNNDYEERLSEVAIEFVERFNRVLSFGKPVEMRPMTEDEMVMRSFNEIGYAVRWNWGPWKEPRAFNYSYEYSCYEWCDTTSGTFGEPHKFEVEA